jgi:hypothetical protein
MVLMAVIHNQKGCIAWVSKSLEIRRTESRLQACPKPILSSKII